MTMTLGRALERRHPQSRPGMLWSLIDDGDGPRLLEWSDSLGPRPTDEHLAAIVAEEEAAEAQEG